MVAAAKITELNTPTQRNEVRSIDPYDVIVREVLDKNTQGFIKIDQNKDPQKIIDTFDKAKAECFAKFKEVSK